MPIDKKSLNKSTSRGYIVAMSDSKIVRLATRGSALAQWQANRVAELLRAKDSSVIVEKVIISTKPDRIQDKPLHAMGDKGLFVKEVEQAVLDGRADAAVHSLKDVPVDTVTPGLVLIAFPEREDPRDVLLSRTGKPIELLPPDSIVATGAPRRQAQLLAMRPDLKVCGVRGNVETRMRKLQDGEFDAIIMAAAGLRRLGMERQITKSLPFDEFVPAPGQGIVVVQAPAASPWLELLTSIDDAGVRLQAETERELSRQIGADCHSAAGAHLELKGENAIFYAAVCTTDGSRCLRFTRKFQAPLMAAEIASAAADSLKAAGCARLMV